MPSSERPVVDAAPDSPSALSAAPNGDVDPQPPLNPAEDLSQPDGADQSGTQERSSRATHELLDAEAEEEKAKSAEPRASGSQLVSGDPLLRGPTSANSAPAKAVPAVPPPKPPKPPKPPAPADNPVSRAAPRPKDLSTSAVTTVAGITSQPAGQPARRASRGAQVTAPRAVVPPTRPPEQPVATLRPTTVAPVPRLAGRRPRVRRVTRVVRHVDPWSVFKVAAAFSIVAYAIALIAGVLLWNVAYATGTIDNIERGMESTGWEVFELDGGEIFHNAWIGGLFGAVALTGLAVLTATLFNLITDLVGGIRLTVLEEEVVEKTASPMRRFATSTTRRSAPPTAEVTGAQGAEARVRRARGG